mgnify:CR=1 FL=1
MNILHKCLELGYENERVLNRRISQLFIDIAYSMSQDISKTLDKLSISRESQQQIPLELLDEMLTDMRENCFFCVWKIAELIDEKNTKTD